MVESPSFLHIVTVKCPWNLHKFGLNPYLKSMWSVLFGWIESYVVIVCYSSLVIPLFNNKIVFLWKKHVHSNGCNTIVLNYSRWLRNPAPPKGWLKPYKSWDRINHRFQLVIWISLAHPQYTPEDSHEKSPVALARKSSKLHQALGRNNVAKICGKKMVWKCRKHVGNM
jgi:hypothetical protein